MILDIDVRSVYGNTTLYPANASAKLVALIAGRKTLTTEHLAAVKMLAVVNGLGCSIGLNGPAAESKAISEEIDARFNDLSRPVP